MKTNSKKGGTKIESQEENEEYKKKEINLN